VLAGFLFHRPRKGVIPSPCPDSLDAGPPACDNERTYSTVLKAVAVVHLRVHGAIHWRLFRELPGQACCKDRSRMITATKSQRRRRRGVPSTEDLLRALRAAQSVGWQGSVAVEHDGEKTVVRYEPGTVETPNQRGLTVIP
jgi:hypothetical protein